MSNLLSGINARIRGTSRSGRSPGPSADGISQPPPMPSPSQSQATASPAAGSSAATASATPMGSSIAEWPRPLPAWLDKAYAKHIVKGNFMTLSARPRTVEQGEWIAHQVVDHYRVLWNFVRVILEKDENGTTICNRATCPKMSAGKNHSYTWLNSRHEPIELPAYDYITLMQRWISGKIDDGSIFPTSADGVSFAPDSASDPSAPNAASNGGGDDWTGRRSGFPREFMGICRTVFLQMFRVYAHLYWDHFVDPFYHLNLEKQLNSCFSHFILTATTLDLLRVEDLEPMKPLIDLWAADGTLPPESRAYAYADLAQGRTLVELSGVTA